MHHHLVLVYWPLSSCLSYETPCEHVSLFPSFTRLFIVLEFRLIHGDTHNTGEWNDVMLAGLRTQLEGAKSTISCLAQEVAQHSQVLEAWKPQQHEGT